MSSYLNHFGCPFYNEKLDKCGFSEKKVKKSDEYKAQCCSEPTWAIYEREARMPTYLLEMKLRSIAAMPPSYVSWQRKIAILEILKMREKLKKRYEKV
ncbi:MAG: hypothetical protein FWD09_02340 [Lentimicrobiaceae bacterium]|nr:hypothetical protein [Lentimicrobiaceae bacterium]